MSSAQGGRHENDLEWNSEWTEHLGGGSFETQEGGGRVP